MQSSYLKLLFAAFAVAALACQKQTPYKGEVVSVSVFNGLDDGLSAYGNYSEARPASYQLSQNLNANSAAFITYFQDTIVRARFYAQYDTLDTDKPLIDQQLTMRRGKSYSLYLAGNKLASDYLFVENTFKWGADTDSLSYMQVVNISNDAPVSVNMKGNAKGSFINSLPYKTASAFLGLNVDKAHPVYEFEFRDANTGELLWTETVPTIPADPAGDRNRFLHNNWTLVFMGKRAGSSVNALRTYRIFYQLK